MEILVETKKNNRNVLLEELHPLGTVGELWPDGSFNFNCYDSECVDQAIEICDQFEVDARLV